MAGTTFTWTATTQSAWTTPSNWSPIGTPAAADTAVVPAGSILVNSGTVAATDVGIGGSLTAPQPSKGTIAVTTGAEILVSDALAVWSGSTLSVDSASSVDIGTSGSRVAGDVVIDNGHSLVGDGLVQASVQNNGTIEVLGTVASNVFTAGTLEITGSVAGAGTVDFSGVSSVVRFDGTVSPSQTIDFGTGSELILNAPGVSFGAPITNLNTGDKIEFNFGPGVTISNVAVNAGTVTVTTTTSSYQLTNVSFAAGANQTFFFNTDASNGDPFIFVAPPFANWVGSVSTDYATPGNWQSGAIPNATESVSFSGNPGTISGTGNALSLNIGGPTTQNWTFSGATITVAGQPSPPFLPYGIGFNANTVLTNATTLNVAGGTTNIGNPTGVTVTAQGASHITTGGDSVGTNSGQPGSLFLTGSGTTWTEQSGPPVNGSIPGFLNVGFNGSQAGLLAVTNSATLNTAGQATFGGTTGSQGSGTISGGGVWNANDIVVGSNGTGTLVINAATISADGTFSAVGNNPGSNGSVSITAGGTLDFTLPGQSSSAVLSIGRAAAAPPQAQAVGSVTVTGVGALLNTNDNPIDVGRGGSGSLTVSQGGSVAAGTPDSNLIYGLSVAYSGGTGSVTVTDPGSTFTLTGFGFDGRGGKGTLTVENSGTFQVNDSANGGGFNVGVGRAAGPTAPTNVGGTGTALVTSNGLLEINSSTSGIGVGGNGASGTLTVDNKGTVLAGTGWPRGRARCASVRAPPCRRNWALRAMPAASAWRCGGSCSRSRGGDRRSRRTHRP
jgi:T5SS/PEP-CTERM-associated repeat protein